MKKHLLPIVYICLLQISPSHANTDDRLEHFLSLSLEELVNLESTIAAKTKQTASEAPAVVTIITNENIKATGATNLTDVLQGVPGIHVRYDHFGFRPLVHFRGTKANQTLLMINGNPLKDLMWSFNFFWKGLPTSMIDRIEIIRGPGSALFGSDASAGVINVITKTAGKIEHSEVGLRVGSFNSKSAWMQHGTQWNGFDINVTADLHDTDGHDPFIPTDGQTLADTATGSNASLAPDEAGYGWKNQDFRFSMAKGNWRLHTDYMSRDDVEIGLTGAGVLDPVTNASDSQFNVDLFFNDEQFSKHWGLDAELRFQHLDYTSGNGFQERPPGYDDGTDVYPNGQINQMRSAERKFIFEVSGLYSGIENHQIRTGIGHTFHDLYSVEQYVNFGTGADGNPINAGDPIENVSGTPYAFAPEKTRRIKYFFIQDIWTISNDWEFTMGARYDDYSDFGDTFNPRLALVWQSSEKLTTKFMYGKAFRAPSFRELYSNTSRSLPNPDLEAEESETLDLSFAFTATNNLRMDTNLFYIEQTDLIGGTGTPRTFQNFADHRIRGIELEIHWQAMKALQVSGNYTVRSHDNEQRSFHQPKEQAYLRIDWGFNPQWNWNLQTNWIGERERNLTGASPDLRDPVDDHFVTDTTIRFAGLKSWEFAASVRNLFDTDAREFTGRAIADDLPLPERNVYAEARYKF